MDFYPADKFVKLKFHSKPYIISDGILPDKTKMLLFGDPKKGKSLLLAQLAMDITNNNPWLNFKTSHAKVMYANYEIPLVEWQSRLVKRANMTKVKITSDLIVGTDFRPKKLDRPEGQAELEKAVYELEPRLVILDSLYKVISGSVNDDEKISCVFDFLDFLIDHYGISVIICHHNRKSKGDSRGAVDYGTQESRGSYEIVAWPDSIVRFISIPPERSGKARLEFECRHALDEIQPVNLQLVRAEAGFKVV